MATGDGPGGLCLQMSRQQNMSLFKNSHSYNAFDIPYRFVTILFTEIEKICKDLSSIQTMHQVSRYLPNTKKRQQTLLGDAWALEIRKPGFDS